MSETKPDILASLAQDVVVQDIDEDVFARLRDYTDPAMPHQGRRVATADVPADLTEGVVRRRVGRPPKEAPQAPAESTPIVAAPVLSAPPAPPVTQVKTAAVVSDTQDDEMTKRDRSKSAMTINAGKIPTFQGIPLPQIQEAREIYPSLPVKISRRNTRGHLAVIGTYDKSPTELADIDMWIKEMWGGGRFRVEPRNPEDPTQYATPIPPFEVEVDGPMKAPNYSPGGGGGPSIAGNGMHEQSAFAPAGSPYGMGGPMMPPSMPHAHMPSQGNRVDPRSLPAFVRNMEPIHQQAYAQQMGLVMPEQGAYTQPVMKFTPDQLMKEELDRAQGTLERERREREIERKLAAKQLEDTRREAEQRHVETQRRLEQIERAGMEERMKERERANERELAALRAEMVANQNRKPAFDPTLVGTVLTAIAPVITAVVTSGRDAQNRTMELQSKGVADLMQATLARSDKNPLLDTLKTAVPLLAPFLKDWWDSKSPRAQADLVATMAENQLTSIGMMARLVNDFSANMGSDGAPPWWLPVVQETMRGVTQAAEKLTQTSKAAVPQVVSAPPQAAQNAQPQQQQQQSNPFAALNGAQIAQLIMSDARLPQGFKTREWLQILTSVHDRKAVPEVASVIALHIRALDDKLPEGLTGLWDTDRPQDVLLQLFAALPIAQIDPQYTAQLVEGILDALSYDAADAPAGTPVAGTTETAPEPVPYNMGTTFPFSSAPTPQKVG